jgi:hypothetical protein
MLRYQDDPADTLYALATSMQVGTMIPGWLLNATECIYRFLPVQRLSGSTRLYAGWIQQAFIHQC